MEERLPFRERKPFEERKKEVDGVRNSHPEKIPIIIERYPRDKLPQMDKCKFLVPGELSMIDIQKIVRRRLHLTPSEALFLLVNKKSMVSNASTLVEVYENEKDQDGFLYVAYASQQTFGAAMFLSH